MATLFHVVLVVDRMDLEGDGLSVYTDGLYHELIQQGLACSILTCEKGFDKTCFRSLARGGELVVHINGLWTPFLHEVVELAISCAVPLLISPHGMLEPWAMAHKFLKKKIAWNLYQKRDIRRASVIHATSSVEVENIRKLGIITSIALIPNATNLPPMVQYSACDKNIKTMLFLSRIHPVKGLLDLIEAWHIVKPKGWKLVIAGQDEDGHKQEVERRVKYLGLESQMQFVGPTFGEDKVMLYRHSDLFILPTYSENFGLVVAEAMSYGVPVITTKAAPWSILEDSQCGWWVDVGVEPLTHALRQGVGLTSMQLQKMGKLGRDIVEREYTWSRIGSKMIELYEWIMGKGERPPIIVD